MAAILSATALSASAQPSAPPTSGANPAAGAGPAAPAVAALPQSAGPTSIAAAEEAALLNLIAGIQSEKLDLSGVAPKVVQALKGQLAPLAARVARLGPVEGVDLLGDAPHGMKRFKVRHGEATTVWAVALDADGKISDLSLTL